MGTRSITFGDFTRCVLYNSSIRFCTRSITIGDFTRSVPYNSAIRFCTRSITFGDSKLNFVYRQDLHCDRIQVTWLQLFMKGEADILLGIVYRPPSENVEWLECFDSQLEAATKSNLELAIFGDFNIDLLNENNSDPKLTQITQLYGLTQVFIVIQSH